MGTGGPTNGPPANCGAVWTQCGGNGWGGPTCCVPGSTCREQNPYYHQCIPGDSPTPAPTPAPTPPPTTTTTRECKPFCAQSSDSWSFKCSWDCCRGCSPCMTAPATTITTTPVTTTTTTLRCRPWCATNTQPWTTKCEKKRCSGCAECLPPGRRLAVTPQQLSDA